LVERSIRKAMAAADLNSIPIYPESRACRRPTADKVYDLFRDVRLQIVKTGKGQEREIPDDLSDIQKLVLSLLEVKPSEYFRSRPT